MGAAHGGDSAAPNPSVLNHATLWKQNGGVMKNHRVALL
jgi:hypothetical protein